MISMVACESGYGCPATPFDAVFTRLIEILLMHCMILEIEFGELEMDML